MPFGINQQLIFTCSPHRLVRVLVNNNATCTEQVTLNLLTTSGLLCTGTTHLLLAESPARRFRLPLFGFMGMIW